MCVDQSNILIFGGIEWILPYNLLYDCTVETFLLSCKRSSSKCLSYILYYYSWA